MDDGRILPRRGFERGQSRGDSLLLLMEKVVSVSRVSLCLAVNLLGRLHLLGLSPDSTNTP